MTHEKKYYLISGASGGVYVKRSLAPDEFVMMLPSRRIVIPLMHLERMRNEVAAIDYIKTHTNIPVPTVRCSFEDNGRFYTVTDEVPGVPMSELSESAKMTVMEEVEIHLRTLHNITSKSMGGFSGDACLPYRLAKAAPQEAMKFKEASTDEFVLCHNDLSQHNIIVDESTLKISAILDWEYAGFYPKEFEGAFYKRSGPSAAIGDEEDDVPSLLSVLDKWRQNVRCVFKHILIIARWDSHYISLHRSA
jgi:aminoglycoside phosphotransferase